VEVLVLSWFMDKEEEAGRAKKKKVRRRNNKKGFTQLCFF